MKDYRPISCCNVLYKTISKILANRLQAILPGYIAPNQSAFIKNRLLMENLLLASELVKDYHKAGISSRCAIKIDISKAFDSVQWPFLLNALAAANLPDKFIHWIKLCVTSASFSVQVNGELAGFFRSKRGLRQGCSLSPYLFVICLNVLSQMLDKAATAGILGFHPKCKSLKLTHLSFADDLMVFTDGTSRSLAGTLEIFQRFAAISGLKISPEKSTIYISGVSTVARDHIVARFGLPMGTLPVRYLGLPLLTKRMTTTDYLPLIEKIRTRISSWKNRFLSYGGRLQLLLSVIASLTNFWISAFRLPSACIKEIERICSAFLWSGSDLNPRKSKVSWQDICRPKSEGGLGIKSLAEMNKVSCLKLIWRIVSDHQSLWVKWIKQSLIRTGSFWSVKETSSTGSWIWKKLLKVRNEAKDFNKVEVRSGALVSFWYDDWCPLGRLHQELGNRGFIDMGINPASSLVAPLHTRRRRRHRNSFLNRVEDEIDNLRAHVRPEEEDVSLWRSKQGKYKPGFSSKETWEQIRRVYPKVSWHKGIWFKEATPKFSFLSWLATLNRLSTGDRMLSWNQGVSPSCTLCRDPLETRDHLFFSCRFSASIWGKLVRGILQRDYTTDFQTLLSTISASQLPYTHLFILRYAFQATVHALWQERNRRRHGESARSSHCLSQALDRTIRNRLSTHSEANSNIKDGLQIWFGSRI